MRRPSHRTPWLPWLALGAATLGLLVAAAPAAACPSCYGAADAPVLDGARSAVIFMGLLVYGLLGGGVAMVVLVRRKAGKATDDGPAPGGR